MADKEISALTAAAALTGAEKLHVDQGGNSRRTTTQDIADLASVSTTYGAVGTYVFGYIANTGVTEGTTYAGSSIEPAGVVYGGTLSDDGTGNGLLTKGGAALSGTWRAMGRVDGLSGTSYSRGTLFVRIS